MNEHRMRGQVDALKGNPRHYGCHVGMRSTLERDRDEYLAGYDEVERLLRRGDK
jgi:hypothetical protein